MKKRRVRIGTRGSQLALTQSRAVKEAIERLHPDCRVDLEIIKTTGDKITDVPLAKVGGKGLFVKEIEDALLEGSVDLAVHSMKDVPAELPGLLEIAVIPRREDPRDVLVVRGGGSLTDLTKGARVGTSSLRRSAQIKHLRPDVAIENLRGNLDTRLRKLEDGMYDAVVLAAAGIHRMGWRDRISSYLDPSVFLPAIGQGALGLEIRRDDFRTLDLIAPIHDPRTAVAVTAERSFLKELEGGCQVPIAGYAEAHGDTIVLTGLVASLDGRVIYRSTRSAGWQAAVDLGRSLARELLDAGAGKILEEVYHSSRSPA